MNFLSRVYATVSKEKALLDPRAFVESSRLLVLWLGFISRASLAFAVFTQKLQWTVEPSILSTLRTNLFTRGVRSRWALGSLALGSFELVG